MKKIKVIIIYVLLSLYLPSCLDYIEQKAKTERQTFVFINSGLVTVQAYSKNDTKICLKIKGTADTQNISTSILENDKIILFINTSEQARILEETEDLANNCINIERGINGTEPKDIPFQEEIFIEHS